MLDDDLGLTGDEATGVRIVRKRVDEPLRWIAENAGDEGYVVVAKVREAGVGNGFNAATGEYGDLVAQGVLDPVKVTRSALANAASIAGMLLTTETLVVEKPEDAEPSRRRRSRPRPRPLTHRIDRRPGQPHGSTGDCACAYGRFVPWSLRRRASAVAHDRSGADQHRRGRRPAYLTSFGPSAPSAAARRPSGRRRARSASGRSRTVLVRLASVPYPGGLRPVDDVAQDICIAVLAALPRYRDRGRPFEAFVHGVASRKVADARRAWPAPGPSDDLPDGRRRADARGPSVQDSDVESASSCSACCPSDSARRWCCASVPADRPRRPVRRSG